MLPPVVNEEQVIRYLLDELGAEERRPIEERLFRERSFFEQVSAIENDLIMQYVCGSLGRGLIPRFTEVYLHSPVRRAQVEAAQVWRQAVLDTARRRPAIFSKGFGLRFAWFTAASAILLLAVLFPLWRSRSGPVHNSHDSSEVAFSLEPGLLRSGDGVQIRVPKATRVVFKLTPANPTVHKSYRVTVGTPERPSTWRGTAVSQGPIVVTTVSGDVLSAGDYSLQLQATDSGGSWENVGVYYFRVVQ